MVSFPFASMVAWDRAAGLHGLDSAVALPVTDAFVEHASLASPSGWDIDDLLGGKSLGPLPVIETSSGQSAVRHAPVDDHEFIAVTDPDATFDWGSYSRNQLAWFLASDGQEILDELCFEDDSCAFAQ